MAILYADFDDDARTDDRDVLVQVREFSRVLDAMGYQIAHVRLGLNVEAAVRLLRETSPCLVVNLVESVAGSDSLQHLGPSVLDFLGIPYTGSPADAVYVSAKKVLAKRMLDAGGIPTPPWCLLPDVLRGSIPGAPPWIVKPASEHASYGIEESSIIADRADLIRRARDPDAGRLYVEAFIEGREINASLLGGPGGTEVLPLAEIDFSGFPPGKPRIVGYRAKWDEASFEYRNTVRRFTFAPEDRLLQNDVRAIARRAWDVLGLRSYARVDFRVDAAGRPWVLEVNANPCLSPDAGFAAAADRAGMSIDALLRRIVENARNP